MCRHAPSASLHLHGVGAPQLPHRRPGTIDRPLRVGLLRDGARTPGGRNPARRRDRRPVAPLRRAGARPLAPAEPADAPAVDPSRFLDQQHARWPGHWASPPARWDELPEEHLTGRETLDALKNAIEALPPVQRQVIVLRDIEGWEGHEVCELLNLTEANQRVLLHRARSKVRHALEDRIGWR